MGVSLLNNYHCQWRSIGVTQEQILTDEVKFCSRYILSRSSTYFLTRWLDPTGFSDKTHRYLK